MKDVLPDKPSELLRLAIHDMKLVERSKGYAIDVNAWHIPCGKICYVCLAGAVMVKRLKVPHGKHTSPMYFPSRIGLKLRAIDLLRTGETRAVIRLLDLDMPNGLHNMYMLDYYENNPAPFYASAQDVITYLESFGL